MSDLTSNLIQKNISLEIYNHYKFNILEITRLIKTKLIDFIFHKSLYISNSFIKIY